MEEPQHEYLNNSPLSNFMDNNSCNVWGKEGSEDLLEKCIILSAVDQGYRPAATWCLKYIVNNKKPFI